MGGFTEDKTTLTLKCALRTASLNEYGHLRLFQLKENTITYKRERRNSNPS
jgi:hypothetical protein